MCMKSAPQNLFRDFPLLTALIRPQNSGRWGTRKQPFHTFQLTVRGTRGRGAGGSEHGATRARKITSDRISETGLVSTCGPYRPRITHCFRSWDSWDRCHRVRSSESHPRKGLPPLERFQTQTSAAARRPQSCTLGQRRKAHGTSMCRGRRGKI